MIIAVDGNEANVAERVGVSTYTLELLRYFAAHSNIGLQFIVYLKNKPEEWMPAESEYFTYKVVWGPKLWSLIFLPLALYIGKKPDVFFAPAHYSPRYCPCPLVVTIHDLAYLSFQEEFLKKDIYKLTNWTKQSIERARSVIAVSQTTKKDIMQSYHLPEQIITVIYNGFSKQKIPTTSSYILSKHNLQKHRYILYVGTLQPRKNVSVLIRAFEIIHRSDPELRLVLVGKKGWMWEPIFEEINKSAAAEHIITTGYIPDTDVVKLYQNALCFVLPSRYEGFGIPVLEAMAHKCPVIVSHSSSLPEIAGEAALYFDPDDPDTLAERIQLVVTNKTTRSTLIKAGTAQVSKFSWETCAERTLAVISQSDMTKK